MPYCWHFATLEKQTNKKTLYFGCGWQQNESEPAVCPAAQGANHVLGWTRPSTTSLAKEEIVQLCSLLRGLTLSSACSLGATISEGHKTIRELPKEGYRNGEWSGGQGVWRAGWPCCVYNAPQNTTCSLGCQGTVLIHAELQSPKTPDPFQWTALRLLVSLSTSVLALTHPRHLPLINFMSLLTVQCFTQLRFFCKTSSFSGESTASSTLTHSELAKDALNSYA